MGEHLEWQRGGGPVVFADVDEDDVLLLEFNVRVVGLRYYQGVVHTGEFATLVREPRNVYDSNAIRIDNLSGAQVGHVNRESAAVLAGLLDSMAAFRKVKVEAVAAGAAGAFEMPLSLSFYCPSSERVGCEEWLLPRLGGLYRRPTGSAHKAGAGRAAVPTLSAVVASRRVVKPIESQRELDEMLQALDEGWADSLPALDEASLAQTLKTRLFPHQVEGVRWMLRRERCAATELPPFWSAVVEKARQMCFNALTASSSREAPPCVRGGINADDMGLGKSIETLACVLSNPPAGVVYAAGTSSSGSASADAGGSAAGTAAEPALPFEVLSHAELSQRCVERNLAKSGTKAVLVARLRANEARAAVPTASSSGGGKGTLIVCPLSLLASWQDQIEAHVRPGALSYHVHHGPSRAQRSSELAPFDIVLVSYQTLAGELESSGGDEASQASPAAPKRAKLSGAPVLDTKWHRIVLDEAHVVRNPKTLLFQAVNALRGGIRWALTGTPVQNKVDDVQPLLAFIRLEPLQARDVWTRAVSRPIRDGDPAGLDRLRLVMRSVTLRRTKALLADRLPPQHVSVVALRLPDAARAAYNDLYNSIAAVVAELARVDDDLVLQHHLIIFEAITRLRQACCSTALVPPERLQRARDVLRRLGLGAGGSPSHALLSKDDAIGLLKSLSKAVEEPASEQSYDCAICLDYLKEETACVLRACQHAFCQSCILQHVQASARGGAHCPLCRRPFAQADVLSLEQLRIATAAADGKAAAADVAATAAAAADGAESAKVLALVEALKPLRACGEKAIVFSNWTSFLDIIARALQSRGFRFTRIDGSLSREVRAQAVREIDAGDVDVALVSTRAGGVGLNLTKANHVFLMGELRAAARAFSITLTDHRCATARIDSEPDYNPAAEQQAMDRCHRLGQCREVHVTRYVCERTIEERVVELSEAKKALAKGALHKLSNDEMRKARKAELHRLLEPFAL
jgi:SWI/SNF-related matrix-associated actin-dependent regulator of chromatin subfamily A3